MKLYYAKGACSLAPHIVPVVLRWLPALGFTLPTWPSVVHYFNQLQQRPAIQQALREEGLSV